MLRNGRHADHKGNIPVSVVVFYRLCCMHCQRTRCNVPDAVDIHFGHRRHHWCNRDTFDRLKSEEKGNYFIFLSS